MKSYSRTTRRWARQPLAIAVPSETAPRKPGNICSPTGSRSSTIRHGFCKSIYFDDPVNGINLEFAVYTAKCTEEEPFLQDDQPVPAAAQYLGDRQERFLLHFVPDGKGGMAVEKGQGSAAH